jgi:hypothetical protein
MRWEQQLRALLPAGRGRGGDRPSPPADDAECASDADSGG